jgi:hypothetical protein
VSAQREELVRLSALLDGLPQLLVDQLRTQLDLDHTRQVITIRRGLR